MRKIFERIEKNNYLAKGTAGHGFDGYFQTNMNKVATPPTQPVLGIVQAMAQNFSLESTDAASLQKAQVADANFLDPKRDWTTGIWGLPQHQKAPATATAPETTSKTPSTKTSP